MKGNKTRPYKVARKCVGMGNCENFENYFMFTKRNTKSKYYAINSLIFDLLPSLSNDSIDHFHNDVKQSLKARRNVEYEKGDIPNSVCIGNCFEAEIRIQI